MTTSGYWPARFGALDSLMPRAPWHIVQFSASVAPWPTDAPLPGRAMLRSRTTSVDCGGVGPVGADDQLPGTPAARQMPAHRPCAVKSPCTDGSQTKPISSDASVSPTSETTLQRTHGLP